MRNLAAKFGKIFDICKKFSKNLVDERGSMTYIICKTSNMTTTDAPSSGIKDI